MVEEEVLLTLDHLPAVDWSVSLVDPVVEVEVIVGVVDLDPLLVVLSLETLPMETHHLLDLVMMEEKGVMHLPL